MQKPKILIIGVGFVGLVTGLCYAKKGFDIIFYDNNTDKIADFKAGRIPFFEPGTEDLLNTYSHKVCFTTSLKESVEESDVIMICVGTTSNDDGSPNIENIYSVAKEIARTISEIDIIKYRLIVQKSTGQPGTCKKIAEIFDEILGKDETEEYIDIISMPEFLREGDAVYDVFHAEKNVVGTDGSVKKDYHVQLASAFNEPILFVSRESAELIKLAHNGMSAMKISYMNAIALLCEEYGANIHDLERALGMEIRQVKNYVRAGMGFAGSCLGKACYDLAHMYDRYGDRHNTNHTEGLMYDVLDINDYMTTNIIDKIERSNVDKTDKIAIWGLSFKPNSSDTRDSRALYLIKQLKMSGYINIVGYDPIVKSNIGICNMNTVENTARGASVIILCVEWDEFRKQNMKKIFELTKKTHPVLIDARNIYERSEMEQIGFKYFGIGK